jgi:hypothetical protein
VAQTEICGVSDRGEWWLRWGLGVAHIWGCGGSNRGEFGDSDRGELGGSDRENVVARIVSKFETGIQFPHRSARNARSVTCRLSSKGAGVN